MVRVLFKIEICHCPSVQVHLGGYQSWLLLLNSSFQQAAPGSSSGPLTYQTYQQFLLKVFACTYYTFYTVKINLPPHHEIYLAVLLYEIKSFTSEN